MSLQEKKLIRPLPIGISEFKKVIDNNCYYSDKTLLIKKLLDTKAEAILFARPRRFGKTLNMTMLRTFFEKPMDGKDTSHYFKDLEIWKKGDKYIKEQGKRPVIYITLKDIKFFNFKQTIDEITKNIANEYGRHDELENSNKLKDSERNLYLGMVNRKADFSDLSTSLLSLSEMLHKHHGIQPMIIIDEYDTPIQTANEYGYYEDMVNFMRIFLSSAFKDNPYLYRGVLTGITRVSKESIFSGLNNLKVNTIFDEEFSDCFGLTKEEVSDMLDFYDIPDKKEEAAYWYDGYKFGNTDIYNPWSMIQYADSDCIAQPYWVNTSSNSLVGQALEMADHYDSTVLESLVNGGEIETEINTNVIYPEIASNVNVAYSLLAQTGYLKSEHVHWDDGAMICALKIPNRELRKIYFDEILNRFVKDNKAGRKAGELRRAISRGNAAKIEQLVQDYLMSSLSFHDL
ncbi:MAG: AAA family ATPase, partial [Elusimicrobiales bacterium]|nr:AAA family ATPase [Elusimicrobiales bacterium]